MGSSVGVAVVVVHGEKGNDGFCFLFFFTFWLLMFTMVPNLFVQYLFFYCMSIANIGGRTISNERIKGRSVIVRQYGMVPVFYVLLLFVVETRGNDITERSPLL